MAELADMKLFAQAVSAGSLSAAGRVLGFSPAVASKRLARLEAELGARLLQRSSRRLALTEEGAIYLERCQTILAEVLEAESAVGQGRHQPRGILRVSSAVALGRRWVGPVLAELASAHPELTVQLSLSDALVDLIDGGFDCAVRIGGPVDSRLIVRPLALNRRVVCASPAYLARRGRPQTPSDLVDHDCIVMSRSASTHADWHFKPCDPAPEAAGPDQVETADRGEHSVRVQGRLATDNGEQAHDWALAGMGLARRSIWDVAAELADGRLVEVLPDWTGDSAPIQVVFASRKFLPARTRLCIDALVQRFGEAAGERAIQRP